jgi:hypothetical protein
MKAARMFLALLGLSALVTGGCASGEVKTMKKLADRMCACQEKACADQVAGDFGKYMDELEGKKITKSDEEDMTKAAARYDKCQQPWVVGAAPAAQ